MPPDFLQTFTDRRHCFAELRALSLEQLSLIDTDDYSRLLSILGSKQRIIGRLEEIGRTHPLLWQDWKLRRDRLESDTRTDCDAILAETEAILADLLEHERASTDHLSRRRDETQLQLQRVTTGTQAQAAYRDSLAPTTHRHLDIGR